MFYFAMLCTENKMYSKINGKTKSGTNDSHIGCGQQDWGKDRSARNYKGRLYLCFRIIFVINIIDDTTVNWQGTIVKISEGGRISNPQVEVPGVLRPSQ
jgi:hypothetical protein